jgi:PASTA domain
VLRGQRRLRGSLIAMAAPHPTKARPSRAKSGAGSRSTRRQIHVDDFSGQTAADAIESARLAGLRPAPERVEVDDPTRHGVVIGHEPKAGETAARGSLLALFVGAGPAVAHEAPEPAEASRDAMAEPPAHGSETDLGLPRPDEPDEREAFAGEAEDAHDLSDEFLAEPPFPLLGPFFEPSTRSTEQLPRRRIKRLYLIAAGAILLLTLIVATAATTRHAVREPKAERTKPPSRRAPAHHLHKRRRRPHVKTRGRARESSVARPTAGHTQTAPNTPLTRALSPPAYAAPAPAQPRPASPERDEFFAA